VATINISTCGGKTTPALYKKNIHIQFENMDFHPLIAKCDKCLACTRHGIFRRREVGGFSMGNMSSHLRYSG
jgi:hypothetical protein